jgi:DUF4097 and DUF4098 domain-containing protein YvlB
MKITHAIALSTCTAFWLINCDGTTGPGAIDFDWSGVVAPGDVIEIKGYNGDINASLATGNEVVVTARKEGGQSDPATVDIEVVTHAGGVTICAVYPDVPGQPANVCAPGDQSRLNNQNNDVEVTFTVAVPADVNFDGLTVNGSVTGTNLESDASALVVNGGVTITTTELAEAIVVNGNIVVTMGEGNLDRDLEFVTVNGNVSVEVPANTNAVVALTAANGNASSDFSLTRINAGSMQGTLGSGGFDLTLVTVNGNVTLLQGP